MNEEVLVREKSGIRAVGKFFWELIKVFLISMAIIIPIRYFLVQPFFVRGASMEPNFEDGEYLVIDQLSYRIRSPERGEVIVFRFPQRPSQFFIKRIIGLPGESVTVQDGRVVIRNNKHPNGVVLDEVKYLSASIRTGGDVTLDLSKTEYFVLGDNRAASSDSRSWGVLPKEEIIGRAWIRAFPFNSLEIFSFERPGFISL